MINCSKKIYKFPAKSLEFLLDDQIKSFRDVFNASSNKKFINIEYDQKSYSVNDLEKSFLASKVQTISFFSGAGGLDIGAQLAGSKVISSLDFDLDSVNTMQQNKYFSHAEHIHSDIKEINANTYSKVISDNNPEKLILIGGPPCQPFSKAGYWVTHKNRLGNEDPRNMIGQYFRMINEISPDGFILENVESLLHPKNHNAVSEMKETTDKMGYNFIIYKANSLDFGVPQKRKRVFFIASKKEIIGSPIKTHGSPQEIEADESLKPYETVIQWIAKYDSDKYFEPEESTTFKTYEKELQQIPPGKNYFALTKRDGHPNPKFEANKRFWSFLLKLHPSLPSWTIAAQPGPWVGPLHWNNRRLRVPEIAALQTFPEDYKFIGSRRSIQKQIGNAVPSLLGKSVIEHLMLNI